MPGLFSWRVSQFGVESNRGYPGAGRPERAITSAARGVVQRGDRKNAVRLSRNSRVALCPMPGVRNQDSLDQVGFSIPRKLFSSRFDFFAFRFSFNVKDGFFLVSLLLWRSLVMAFSPGFSRVPGKPTAVPPRGSAGPRRYGY